MSENKENVCLKALEDMLKQSFDKDEYSLGDVKESAVCLVKNGKSWEVFEKEKNSRNDLASYNNIVEACIEMIRRMYLSRSEKYIEEFLEHIVVEKTA